MHRNKLIERDGQSASKIFDDRTLQSDYRTLIPLLKPGLKVLDVGCATGSISSDIARLVGPSGSVIGIDNTFEFIKRGKQNYADSTNLTLINVDLFDYDTEEKFDLIIAARVLQWLSNPKEALLHMKTMLKSGGTISILDYNHNMIEWEPQPPESMLSFYATFLRWREDARMNNRMADDLPTLMDEVGMVQIQILNSDEIYDRSRADFKDRIRIWSKVAGSQQMVKEGYLDNALRLRAIADYDKWVDEEAVSMTMKLNEVRGKVTI